MASLMMPCVAHCASLETRASWRVSSCYSAPGVSMWHSPTQAYRDQWIRTMLPPPSPVLGVSLDHDPWIRSMPQPPPATRAARRAGYPHLTPLPLIAEEASLPSFSLSVGAARSRAYQSAHHPACSRQSPCPQRLRVQPPAAGPASAAAAGELCTPPEIRTCFRVAEACSKDS